MNKKIIVDIVCPYGGAKGGVEEVIRAWKTELDADIFRLRVFHMTPGTKYLDGFEDVYHLTDEKEYVDASYCASGYNLFLTKLGAPDICIATNEPLTTTACKFALNHNGIKIPLFSWVHSDISRYERCGNGGVADLLNADYHLAINSHIRDDILAKKPDATVYTIGNPILHEIPEASAQSNDFILAFVGRLAMEKRVDLILEAMVKAKSPWRLKIIGDGQLMDECHKWVKILRLNDRVTFLGWQDNPLLFMQDATAFISASDYEGLMVAGIEALAMGKMMISTPHQGALECLKEGENGYFFDFNDADGLSKLLDDIAFGKKAVPAPETCKESVSSYRKENYFNTVKSILLDAHEKRAPA